MIVPGHAVMDWNIAWIAHIAMPDEMIRHQEWAIIWGKRERIE